jgi:transcriptional regulator with XRE-family HTH domain
MRWEDIVAANLRRIRKARGMSQEQLALQADIAMRSVGMIERAEMSATVGMLGKLAQALEATPAEFFAAQPTTAASDERDR